MQKQQLRKADFVSSIVILAGAFFFLWQTFQIPMTDSYGGVENVWYVSPALFPLIVCLAIIALGFVLLVNAVKEQGATGWFTRQESENKIETSLSRFRFFTTVFFICTYVYVYLPRVDFFLSTVFVLFIIMFGFYPERLEFLKRSFFYYLYSSGLILVTFGLESIGVLNEFRHDSPRIVDAFLAIIIVAFAIHSLQQASQDAEIARKIKQSIVIALIFGVLLCPIFKYFFLIPLPTEGFFLEVMDSIYYCSEGETWEECLFAE